MNHPDGTMSRPSADQKRKVVFIALSRPEILRSLLYTNAYDVMRDHPEIEIVLLAPDPEALAETPELTGRNVRIEKLDKNALVNMTRGSRLRSAFELVRLLTYNGNAHRGPMARDVMLEEQRQLALSANPSWRGRLYFRALFTLPYLLSRSKPLRRAWVAIGRKLFYGRPHANLYEKYRPELIILSSTGYGLDSPLIAEAREYHTRSVAIIKSWDNPTTRGYPGAPPDHVIAWSHVMMDDVVRFLDLDSDQVEVCGVPYWDAYFSPDPNDITREQFFHQLNLDPDRKVIYYPTATPKMYRENIRVAEVLARAVSNGRISIPAQIVVRPHPGYWERGKTEWEDISASEIEELRNLAAAYPDTIRVDWPNVASYAGLVEMSPTEPVSLRGKFLYSDVMVANYSTQAIEAAVFDLPTVNVAMGNYKRTNLPNSVVDNFPHYRRVIETGALFYSHDEKTLVEGINRYLEDPSADRDGRRRLMEQELPVNRGTAGKALGDKLVHLINGPDAELP